MPEDDDEELDPRQARAARLRKQIDRLKQDHDQPAPEEAGDSAAPERPRDFIERRMRELDEPEP